MTATEAALIIVFLAGMFAGLLTAGAIVAWWEDTLDG